DHARGHLLRRHVRRLDHVDPRQRPRRSRLGRHAAGRPPADEERTSRARRAAKHGGAAAPLTIAAVGSFFAGTVGVVGIMLAAGWLADVAIQFGPPEYFAITLGGILLLSRLSGGSILNAFVMVALGLALGTVGMDSISALRRFTFGSVQLAQGIELVPVIMGVYGVAEFLLLAEEGIAKTKIASVKLRELLPTPEEWRRSTMPIARGSIIGFLTGLVPGPAA